MSHIHGDPDRMIDFAHFLNAWCAETRDRLGNLRARLQEMGAGDWNDENYQRYVEQFEPLASAVLRNLSELDGELVPHLRQLAGRYQDVRDSGR